ncbi:MAG: cupin domain-containing protein [Chitinophagaceae bacterium]|nr:cupin domain-containing protein [Chitinophagaceae bacterium]
MKKYFNFNLILLALPLVLFACNGNDTTTSTGSTTDSTKTTGVDSSAKGPGTDAAAVAPNLYQVVKDTMGIRILKVTYKPGDSSAMHSHPDNVLYVVDGAKMQFTMPDGSTQVHVLTPGMTVVQSGSSHSVKNIGNTTANAYLFEVNRANTAGTTNPAMDAVKVAPALYKIMKDTMNIRVLEATYKPGASSALHAHPDNAIYVIEGGNSEFTDKDGKKQPSAMAKEMATVMPAGVHGVKNIGTVPTKVLIVEVNRPAK